MNKNKNLISFILPYHKQQFEKNIKYIIKQIDKYFSNVDYEILLVKNKDYEFPYKELKNPFIRHVEIMSNYLYRIRMFGIKEANAKYLSFIDVDDVFGFKNLADHLDEINKGDYDIGSFCVQQSVTDKPILWKVKSEVSEISFKTLMYKSLAIANKIFKKSLASRITADLKVSYDEDVAMWMQMSKPSVRILHINKPFWIFGDHPESITRTFGAIQLETIKVNQFLETITNDVDFQILLFRFVCSKLIDIKLIPNKESRKKNYAILTKYIKAKYNKKIINKTFKRSTIIMCKPWFISLATFLIPRKFLVKKVRQKVNAI